MQLGGADLQPLGKGGHDGGPDFGGNGLDEQLLLGAHAAADENELWVKDVHHACKALCDLIRPGIQQGQNGLVASLRGSKNGAAVFPGRVLFLRGPYQSSGGGVALPAAGGTAGAGDTDQCMGAVVTQLTAQSAGTLQKAAAGQDAAAHAGAQGHADDIGITLCAADPDLAQRHAVGIVGDGDG